MAYIQSVMLTGGPSAPIALSIPESANKVMLQAVGGDVRVGYDSADTAILQMYFTIQNSTGNIAPLVLDMVQGMGQQLWVADGGSPALLQVWVI